jgi:uncharacterized membrane protein
MVSVAFNPIGSWFIVALFALGVTGLTVWAYARRLRGTQGVWRWIALGLRLAAILLCLIAALRPSVVFQEKRQNPASLIFLLDDSTSMTINDEVNSQKRWEFARKTLKQAREAAAKLGEGLTAKFYRFDSTLRDDPENDDRDPTGRETAIGAALLEAVKRESGTRVASIFLLSDGNNNSGIAPSIVARQLKSQQVPVVSVAFGSESAGTNSRDLAIRDLVAGPTVFVKNLLQVKGTLVVRGFANQTVDLELVVEGQDEPVATQRIKVPEGVELIPITGLKYIPQTPGEKRITLRVKPKDGELVPSNNSISTFITVLSGGLNVLFVQGSNFTWEKKFLMRSIASSPDIQADLREIRGPVRAGVGELKDEEFAAGRYNVYIFSDLAADFLTPTQHALLARAIDKGAGLIMLGGRSSFGPGGWGSTELARILPAEMSVRDGQIEPDGGVKFIPNTRGLENYLLQIGSDRTESARLWESLPPLSGINRLGTLKPSALVLGQSQSDRPEPIMVANEAAGNGRALAFAGETWFWARISEEGRLAHRKFWRQVIFWLSHKEDKGENEVKLALDARRIASGQKLDFSVTAQDAKGAPLTGLTYETKVEREGAGAGASEAKFSERIDLFNQGEEQHGMFIANQTPPGDYRVSVVATREGKPVGHDSARFLIYQDDRELENPAADRALLRQIAEASGGQSLAPEQLATYLQSLKGKIFTETYNATERKVWDNWPFLLLFTTLLMLEWGIRKKNGWV